VLHIGAESGSNRILELIHKNCTVEDIIACNKKLAKYPKNKANYNFMVGFPTETIVDSKKHATL
jgi:anaerobic magnesium-protoporphyrin IX monomethyl ester cyclase